MDSIQKPLVLALVGPTGVGKTEVSLAVAEALDAEVVSMDSMQIYRGLDIGTAKVDCQTQSRIAHHLIDVADITESWTVAMYREAAEKAISQIDERNHIPLMVGGTGLYLDAIRYQMRYGEIQANAQLREDLHRLAKTEEGIQQLYDLLREASAERANQLHPHDVRRVIRALEIAHAHGVPLQDQPAPNHPTLVYGLTCERGLLYERIDKRVDKMIELGLAQEVARLLQTVPIEAWGTASQAIGYKEWIAALQGAYTTDEAIRLIKRNSRRYAKRQLTWFKRSADICWFDVSEYPGTAALSDAVIASMRKDLHSFSHKQHDIGE